MKPAPPVTRIFTAVALLQVGSGVVAEHQPGRVRLVAGPDDLDLAAEQRVLDPVHAEDPAAVEHDRVFDLGVDELAVGADRRVRPDVGVDEPRAGADDRPGRARRS